MFDYEFSEKANEILLDFSETVEELWEIKNKVEQVVDEAFNGNYDTFFCALAHCPDFATLRQPLQGALRNSIFEGDCSLWKMR